LGRSAGGYEGEAVGVAIDLCADLRH